MENKKIVFTRPWKVEIQTEELDATLEAKEVLVENIYTLISSGTELACLAGSESWFEMPETPGYIACSKILKTGSKVENFKKGDIVFTYAPHAKYHIIDLTDRFGGMCIKLPAELNKKMATFTRIASIAITAIRNSSIELGDFVAVTGMGLVGNLAAQLAALQGARVIGIDIDPQRLKLAQKCGVEMTVNNKDENWKEQITKLTNEQGVSTLIDATGMAPVINDSLDIIALYGETILLGSPRTPFEANLTELLNKVHLPNFVELKGALEWRYPSFKDEFVKHSLERNSEIIMELIKSEKLNIKPLLTHTFPPEKAQQAYHGLKENKDEYLGVVFEW